MRLYATEDDLDDWLEDAPDDVAQHLRFASSLVEAATRNDRYDVHDTGLPATEHVADALRDAVCVQVSGWVAAGIVPVAGSAGISSAVSSTSILSGSVSYEAGSVNAARRQAAVSLSSAALMVLQNAGLASRAVTGGNDGGRWLDAY